MSEDAVNNDRTRIRRAGMHAYISKVTTIRMGLETAKYLNEL